MDVCYHSGEPAANCTYGCRGCKYRFVPAPDPATIAAEAEKIRNAWSPAVAQMRAASGRTDRPVEIQVAMRVYHDKRPNDYRS